MENQKNPEQPQEELWLDDILGPQESAQEIGPDEDAVASAGLTEPGDIELDALLEEIKSTGLMDGATAMLPQVPEEDRPAPEAEPAPAAESVPGSDAPLTDGPFLDEEFRDTFGNEGQALEQVFAESAPEAQEPAPAAEAEIAPPPKKKGKRPREPKRRPARKKGYGLFGIPHIIATFVWIGLAIVIGTTAGNVLWLMASDVLAFGVEPKTVTITITEEDTLDTVTEQLHEAEMIRYPELFKFFATFTGKDQEISTGTFTFNAPDPETGKIPGISYDYNALLNSMQQYAPARETVTIFFAEGYTCKDIFEKLEEKGVCSVADLEEYAANGEIYDYWFLEGVERGHKYSLEGYLFPDTYDFYKDDEPGRVLHKFLDAFDARFTDKMKGRLELIGGEIEDMMRSQGLSEEFIANHPIGIREIVTIASMIEKESGGADESYTISSVIYNRLTSPSFDLLQLDATVIYSHIIVFGEEEIQNQYLDEPHNTYVYSWLPIGPIANPGSSSLNAALNPEDTNYYYYALYENSSKHGFFSTLWQFEEFLWENGYYD